MGTYSLKVTVSVSGTPVGSWKRVAACDDNLIAGVNNQTDVGEFTGNQRWCDGTTPTNPNQAIRYNFSLSDNIISLDGGALISFNTLPSGFRILSQILSISIDSNGVVSPPALCFLQFNSLTESSGLIIPISITARNFTKSGLLTSIGLFADGYGIRFSGLASGNLIGIQNAHINGNYDIVSFTWTIDTPGPVESGQSIEISGDSGLDGVATVHVFRGDTGASICTVSGFDVQTATSLIFNLCNLGSFSGTIYLYAEGNGVQFSGMVPMGSLTVLATDGSGLYVLTPGKTNDTIYTNSGGGSNTTEDVKIPNPFFKTGFIGG